MHNPRASRHTQTWVELCTTDSGKEKQSCGPSGLSFTRHDFVDTRLLKNAIASDQVQLDLVNLAQTQM